MPDYRRGETVRLWRNCKDPDTGEYYDPSTSMKLIVDHPLNGIEVDNEDMVKDETGKHHYYFNIPDVEGQFRIKVQYIATDGAHTAKNEDEFTVG